MSVLDDRAEIDRTVSVQQRVPLVPVECPVEWNECYRVFFLLGFGEVKE